MVKNEVDELVAEEFPERKWKFHVTNARRCGVLVVKNCIMLSLKQKSLPDRQLNHHNFISLYNWRNDNVSGRENSNGWVWLSDELSRWKTNRIRYHVSYLFLFGRKSSINHKLSIKTYSKIDVRLHWWFSDNAIKTESRLLR